MYSLCCTQLCVSVFILTEATSSLKLLTVEVHLPGELVLYRILKAEGVGQSGMQFHLSCESLFAASDLWPEHAKEQCGGRGGF